MNGVAEVVNAVAGLAWPLIVALVLWRLMPSIKKIVESRSFTVKVGQTELTVQELSQKFIATTADIQASVGQGEAADATPQPQLNRILWVDDRPSNNTYQVAQLQALGVDVEPATSTREGLNALLRAGVSFDAVISDLGRDEPGGFNPDAGLDLIRQVRERGLQTPIFIYGTKRAVARSQEIAAAGGNGVTNSATELFAQLRTVGTFPRPVVT